jgi:RNA polymerase sigma factor (sigma-70 family)
MDDRDWLAARFETSRPRLRAVAYRMLGTSSEADDAVQETWLRLSRTDAAAVENLEGWLTTAVARASLDLLRSRRARRETTGDLVPESISLAAGGPDPEREAVVADSVGLALLVVLDTLTPAERLAFVLHDLFAVPFDEIAPIVGRSPVAARQLASRARRRVQGAPVDEAGDAADAARRREVVGAFLAASRDGDFSALLELLDPEVVLRADPAAVVAGATDDVRGADAVAATFSGRARTARLALLDGEPGAVWSVGGRPRVAFAFEVEAGRIVAIDLLADPATLSELTIEPLAG